MVKISRRFDEGKSTKKSCKNLRYGPRTTVSNHLKFWKFENQQKLEHFPCLYNACAANKYLNCFVHLIKYYRTVLIFLNGLSPSVET